MIRWMEGDLARWRLIVFLDKSVDERKACA